MATDLELCDYVGANLPESEYVINELFQRGAVSDLDLNALKERQVDIGNSECAVRAIWGKAYTSKQLDSLNKYGDIQSHVIYSCSLDGIKYCPYTKIDFVNGVIVSIEKNG